MRENLRGSGWENDAEDREIIEREIANKSSAEECKDEEAPSLLVHSRELDSVVGGREGRKAMKHLVNY